MFYKKLREYFQEHPLPDRVDMKIIKKYYHDIGKIYKKSKLGKTSKTIVKNMLSGNNVTSIMMFARMASDANVDIVNSLVKYEEGESLTRSEIGKVSELMEYLMQGFIIQNKNPDNLVPVYNNLQTHQPIHHKGRVDNIVIQGLLLDLLIKTIETSDSDKHKNANGLAMAVYLNQTKDIEGPYQKIILKAANRKQTEILTAAKDLITNEDPYLFQHRVTQLLYEMTESDIPYKRRHYQPILDTIKNAPEDQQHLTDRQGKILIESSNLSSDKNFLTPMLRKQRVISPETLEYLREKPPQFKGDNDEGQRRHRKYARPN